MALQKTNILPNGAVTNYHRIKRVVLVEGNLFCILESYTSQEYRQSDIPVTSDNYQFSVTVKEEESMGIRALCYNKLKQLEEWRDATDC